ncbi:unnamed protein product [Thelazia callipaeda]|uniref:PQ loop repeat family protein n=1 Tax=Thelazia callipaeda TaxID=103827 RepID=A0A0N5D3G4_THECL|nr:unnamed protein product [Thelazia callipaeda]
MKVRYVTMTLLLFRTVPKLEGFEYKSLLKMSTEEEHYLSPKCVNGIKWIMDVFGDCVDTDLKFFGFVIGFISLFLWLLPLIPQLLHNYRTKRCEGLSMYFLLFWILGDSCNMAGALLTNQQPLQKIIGVYYVLQDMTLLFQYFYYTRIYRRNEGIFCNRSNFFCAVNNCASIMPLLAVHITPLINSTAIVPSIFVGLFVIGALFSNKISSNSLRHRPTHETLPGNRRLLSIELGGQPLFHGYYDVLGYVIGSVSATCYFASRIPQLLKNYYRQSCEGLSLVMFYIIIGANVAYGLSVLLGGSGWHYILRHLPWLVGSLGVCVFDVFVVIQHFYYDRLHRNKDLTEQEGLLEDID